MTVISRRSRLKSPAQRITGAISPEQVSLNNELFVTIDSHATSFYRPGESNNPIYRPDLPATGVVEGWAVPEITAQISELMAGQWPDIEVIIDAGERETEVLARTLINRGVGAYPAHIIEAPEMASPAETEWDSTQDWDGAEKELPPRRILGSLDGGAVGVIGALVVLLVVLVLSVVAIARLVGGEDGAAPEATAAPETSVINPTTVPPSAPPPNERVATDRFSAELPAGYSLSQRPDGAFQAVGNDPDLRIIIASDAVSGVTDESFVEEMTKVVESDPSLQLTARIPGADGSDGGRPRVEYTELPGDGSQIAWVSWVEGDRQFSVGCHSRSSQTQLQAQACAVVEESLTFP